MTSPLETVRKNIHTAAINSGRQGGDVTLVAVSKTKSIDAITPILDRGQRVFGENKI
ncbi:MAG: hypothetical protein JKY59_06930, partial [Emcibacter sp.]|nr:hypothetical protein [Emcibacter sp.]